MRPLVGRHDPRDEVEREDPIGARRVAIDGEADPLRDEERVRGPDPLLEPLVGQRAEALVERAVVGPRASVGLEHLVEELPDVVPLE